MPSQEASLKPISQNSRKNPLMTLICRQVSIWLHSALPYASTVLFLMTFPIRALTLPAWWTRLNDANSFSPCTMNMISLKWASICEVSCWAMAVERFCRMAEMRSWQACREEEGIYGTILQDSMSLSLDSRMKMSSCLRLISFLNSYRLFYIIILQSALLPSLITPITSPLSLSLPSPLPSPPPLPLPARYYQQQQQMSGHIKTFHLSYESKPSAFPLRSKKTDASRSLLRQINVLKVFARATKAVLSHPPPPQQKDTISSEQRREDQRQKLIVVSKFRSTSQAAQLATIQSLSKNFKLNRQRIRTYASQLMAHNQRSEKSLKCHSGKDLLQTAKSTQKMGPGLLEGEKESQSLIARKSRISSYTLSKEKYSPSRIQTEKGQGRLLKANKKEMKTLSTEKVSQKKHPILPSNNLPDLKFMKSQSFILVQYPSQKVILSRRPTLPCEIASLTKIMTFYTVLHIAAATNTDVRTFTVTISEGSMQIPGTSAQLAEGQEYTIQQLLYGLMLPSGNDAANELASWGGSVLQSGKGEKGWQTAFINEMNKQARILGLKHTQFGNPHGLPNQCAKSNAADIAKLCCRCMKGPLFRKIVSCKEYKVAVKGPRGTRVLQWENTNKLLRRQGFIGIKTGITATAGPCLASAYSFRGKTFISVVLRAPKVSSRFKQTRKLLFSAMSTLFKDLKEDEYVQLRALKRENYELDSDYSQEEEEFQYGNKSIAEHQRRCNILEEL